MTKQIKKMKMKMKMTAMSEGWQLKTNLFLSDRFVISLITWLPLIPNFVVHGKPRWWCSNFFYQTAEIWVYECDFIILFITSM